MRKLWVSNDAIKSKTNESHEALREAAPARGGGSAGQKQQSTCRNQSVWVQMKKTTPPTPPGPLLCFNQIKGSTVATTRQKGLQSESISCACRWYFRLWIVSWKGVTVDFKPEKSPAEKSWKHYINPAGLAPLQKAHITSPWHFVLAQSNTPTPPRNLVERCHVAGLSVNLNKAHLRHRTSAFTEGFPVKLSKKVWKNFFGLVQLHQSMFLSTKLVYSCAFDEETFVQLSIQSIYFY